MAKKNLLKMWKSPRKNMLKYFIYSILINLVLLYFYSILVLNPLKAASKIVAKNWCEMMKVECKFK